MLTRKVSSLSPFICLVTVKSCVLCLVVYIVSVKSCSEVLGWGGGGGGMLNVQSKKAYICNWSVLIAKCACIDHPQNCFSIHKHLTFPITYLPTSGRCLQPVRCHPSKTALDCLTVPLVTYWAPASAWLCSASPPKTALVQAFDPANNCLPSECQCLQYCAVPTLPKSL